LISRARKRTGAVLRCDGGRATRLNTVRSAWKRPIGTRTPVAEKPTRRQIAAIEIILLFNHDDDDARNERAYGRTTGGQTDGPVRLIHGRQRRVIDKRPCAGGRLACSIRTPRIRDPMGVHRRSTTTAYRRSAFIAERPARNNNNNIIIALLHYVMLLLLLFLGTPIILLLYYFTVPASRECLLQFTCCASSSSSSSAHSSS
jgi:hypothetical protein